MTSKTNRILTSLTIPAALAAMAACGTESGSAATEPTASESTSVPAPTNHDSETPQPEFDVSKVGSLLADESIVEEFNAEITRFDDHEQFDDDDLPERKDPSAAELAAGSCLALNEGNSLLDYQKWISEEYGLSTGDASLLTYTGAIFCPDEEAVYAEYFETA
ncbi:hypothetical protein [Haloglycomyces albus]|uniref:hypothetical protein n=1 Tax=Haloglycomyces albus TaxID=526067 RepID=UPI00046CD8FE|nr:hypothetical protein [Haloglycomyces albus]